MGAVAALVLTVVSITYQAVAHAKAKKAAARAKREAERQAELAKGFQYTEEGQAASLGIAYGRSKIGGVRVHFKVTDNFQYHEAPAGCRVFSAAEAPSAHQRYFVWEMVNTESDWSGTWSVSISTVDRFRKNPGWVYTQDKGQWTLPNRSLVTSYLAFEPPDMAFVFCPFQKHPDPNYLDPNLGQGVTMLKPPKQPSEFGHTFILSDEDVARLIQQGHQGYTPKTSNDNRDPLNASREGDKNEYLFVQQAICQGGLDEIVVPIVDDRLYSYDAYRYGLRINAYLDGGTPDPLMSVNDATRVHSRFTKVAYATEVFKLNRDEPQFNGTPDVKFLVRGMKIHDVVRAPNGGYRLSDKRVYSNNSALVLLDYLLNADYGRTVTVDDIDLESFYKAARVCNIRVAKGVPRHGDIWTNSSGVDKDYHLYEFNSVLDSATSTRDNINKIVDSMTFASLVWTEGKYRLNLPYALVFDISREYDAEDIVQVVDADNKQRLFRCIQPVKGVDPLTSPSFWAEDVIDPNLRELSEDDMILGSDVQVSWPDASVRLNFANVRFMNEEQNFAEDTVCWPEKEPDGPWDRVYEKMLKEDGGVPLETEFYAEGSTTPAHAKARAEQAVRMSREQITYTFKFTTRAFVLEPGDLFGFSSKYHGIPYSVLRVEEMSIDERGQCSVTATTFDARVFAWNVDDFTYEPLPNLYAGYTLRQARNLRIRKGGADNRASNYVLEWDPANDNRVTRYIVRYTTERIKNVTSTSTWTDIGIVSGCKFELPPLDGIYTFAVVSQANDGRIAPFYNIAEVSYWPMIEIRMSADFLDMSGPVIVNLTNDHHQLNCDNSWTPRDLAHSGTAIQVFNGPTALAYDGVGEAKGTWRLEIAESSGVTPGAYAVDKNDGTRCVVQPLSAATAKEGKIIYRAVGTSITGSGFSETKAQRFKKVIDVTRQGYLLTSPEGVVMKSAPNAITSGVHTTVDVFGGMVENGGRVNTDWGWLTLQKDVGPESEKVAGKLRIQPTAGESATDYTVRLYANPSDTQPVDMEVIPVVFRGMTGSNALSFVVANATHALACDSAGNVASYVDSGTALYMYEGAARLRYDGRGEDPGTWKFTMSATNITPSDVIVDEGEYAKIGDHKDMVEETAAIVYTAIGKNGEGAPFEMEGTQTFLKSRRGAALVEVILSNGYVVFPTDEYGTVTSYNGTGTEISVFEGNSRLRFDGNGGEAGTYRIEIEQENIRPNPNGVHPINGENALVGNATEMIADTARLRFVAKGKTRGGEEFVQFADQMFIKNKQGVTGKKSAEVFLYAWSMTLPGVPGGNSRFDWETMKNEDYVPVPGDQVDWKTEVPENPGVPLVRLWTARKRIEAPNNALFTDVAWTDSTVGDVTQNGAEGSNVGSAILYQWAVTIPAPPVGSSTWNWSSRDFDWNEAASEWKKHPGNPIAGQTLWAAEVRMVDTASKASSTINWVTAAIGARSYAGLNGQSAALLRIVPDSQIFVVSQDGNGSPQTINFTLDAQNLPPGANVAWRAEGGTLRHEGDRRVLRFSEMPGETCKVIATYGGLSDETTVFKVKEGHDALTMVLSNEAHTVAADSKGNVTDLSSARTTVSVYRGAADITNQCNIGISAHVSATAYMQNNNCIVTAIYADNAYIDIMATFGGIHRVRRFTLTRARTGDAGNSYVTAYTAAVTPTAYGSNLTMSGLPPQGAWGLQSSPGVGAVWGTSPPQLSAGQFLYQTDGIKNSVTGLITWSVPYWSSLKVGSLSAITANMGQITAGRMRSADGQFVIDLDAKYISISV